MLLKTRGIVLHNVKYADKKIISRIYTREQGIRSYMVNVSSSAKSKLKPALLLPLNQLEMEVFAKENKDLGRISEVRCTYQYTGLGTDMYKNAVASFINEVLYRCIHEQESNPFLFDFIEHSLQWLDVTHEPVYNFHLYFMAELSRYLGFYPQNNYNETENIFDLAEGVFIPFSPAHPDFLTGIQSKDFSDLFSVNLHSIAEYQINREQRLSLLSNLIHYYRLHVPGLKEFKSLAVLQATLS
jgi:DNA repair protein RecO (recombination protein O)